MTSPARRTDAVALVADRLRESYADASPVPYWLDQPGAPEPAAPLDAPTSADLAIVGAGFTGLWAAIQAKEEEPDRDVLVVEQDTVAFGASGRNGGFCDATLTHGLPNGIDRFPDEIGTIERIASENFAGIEAAIERHGIDCDWNAAGEVLVARGPHEVEWMRESAEQARRFGQDAVFLDRDAVRAELDSPTYLAGTWKRSDCAMVDPARLAWGLRRAALDLGVRLYEHTPATGIARTGAGVRLTTPAGAIDAKRVVLATNGFPPLVRAIRRYVVPVYDYVLMTEPLTGEQRASIGWARRQGFADSANHFHYYRLSADGRILWGGYDAIYHWRNGVARRFEQRDATFATLATHFFETFPQLEDVRFSHRWGGVIDTCSRFSVMFGQALDGRVAYAVGYTGMGVAATRFGARVALDLVDGRDTERTRLRLVRSRPVPFPPEPLRYTGIQLTTRALTRADARAGRRGPWLRMLDAVGLGFDS
jgi:glycine/D-amino acid oxidase-like deaminating enzyme